MYAARRRQNGLKRKKHRCRSGFIEQLKRGRGKKSWPEEYVAEFCQQWQKWGRSKFSKVVSSFSIMINFQRQRTNLILIFN
jgi:hypothetical protein